MQNNDREKTPSEKIEFWQKQIRFWQESGLSQSDFCKQHGIRSSQWFYWKKRCRQTEPGLTLVPVKLSSLTGPSRKTAAIRVITPNGFTIELDCDSSLQSIPQLIREVAAI
jgi:transposase-like protein